MRFLPYSFIDFAERGTGCGARTVVVGGLGYCVHGGEFIRSRVCSHAAISYRWRQLRGCWHLLRLFLSALLAMGLLTMLISALVKTVGLGFADRFLGSLFGFMRGMLVVLLAVLAAGFTTRAAGAFLEKGLLSAPLETVAMMIIPWLPQDLSTRINYVKAKRD